MINTFTGLHAGYYDLVYADKPYAAEVRFVLTEVESLLGRRPRTLRNPRTGLPVSVSGRIPRFKPSKELKQAVR